MKNFYKKSLKIFHKFNDAHEQGKFLKENEFTLSINRIYDLHNNELSLENGENQNISLKECMVFDQHISVNTHENTIVFPDFIARKYITYKTKNTSFEVILLPIGSFVHKFIDKDDKELLDLMHDFEKSDDEALTGYWALDKNEMGSIPIHFHIDTPSYIGETKVSKQLWEDIMGDENVDVNALSSGKSKKKRAILRKRKEMNLAYKTYLSRYTYQTEEINELVCGEKRNALLEKFDDETINEMLNEQAFLQKSLNDVDSQFKKDFNKNVPISDISFFDCVKFCNKLSIECGLIPYYDDVVISHHIIKSKFKKLKFKTNPKSNGFRLPFALEWFYALVKGFDAYKNKSLSDIGAFEIDSSVEFVPMPFKHLKYSDKNEKMGSSLCDLKMLQGENHFRPEEIRYVKLGQPNSLGIYDLLSRLGEVLGEISYTIDPDFDESDDMYIHDQSIFERYLKKLKKNKITSVLMSQYISQIDENRIKSYKFTDSKLVASTYEACQFAWLNIFEFDQTLINTKTENKETNSVCLKDYKIQSFDDSNFLKDLLSNFELGLPTVFEPSLVFNSPGVCSSLRIVKNIPRYFFVE